MTTGRVLVLMNTLGLGGSEINAVQFAAQVREHGYESILIAPADTMPVRGPSVTAVAAEYGVEISIYQPQPTVLKGARLLSSIANETRADIVHVYSQHRMRAAYLGPCICGRRPLVITAYEMHVSPFTLGGPPMVVGTKYLEESLVDRAGSVTLISPPVDTDRDNALAGGGSKFRHIHGISEDDVLAVWVGRLAKEMKSPAVRAILGAAELLDRTGLVVAIVGSGDAESDLRAEASRINARLNRRAVVFIGAMAETHAAYAAADIEIGMGSSAARALAYGRPLVAVGEAGWSARFDERTAAAIYRNSFWSDLPVERPAEHLARQLEPLIVDSALRERLGTFGRGFVQDNFSLTRMTERLADVYESSRHSYGISMWAKDLNLELAAARHRLTRNFLSTADVSAEYKFSESFAARKRANAAHRSRRLGVTEGGTLDESRKSHE